MWHQPWEALGDDSAGTPGILRSQFKTAECNWCPQPGWQGLSWVRPRCAGGQQGLSWAGMSSPAVAAHLCSVLPGTALLHLLSPAQSQELSSVVGSAWQRFALWCQFWLCGFLSEGIWHFVFSSVLCNICAFSLCIPEHGFCVDGEATSLLQRRCSKHLFSQNSAHDIHMLQFLQLGWSGMKALW